MRRMRRAGATFREIAGRFDVSRPCAFKHCKGVTPSNEKQRFKRVALEAYLSGLSATELKPFCRNIVSVHTIESNSRMNEPKQLLPAHLVSILKLFGSPMAREDIALFAGKSLDELNDELRPYGIAILTDGAGR